jgi:hypothetical protein
MLDALDAYLTFAFKVFLVAFFYAPASILLLAGSKVHVAEMVIPYPIIAILMLKMYSPTDATPLSPTSLLNSTADAYEVVIVILFLVNL